MKRMFNVIGIASLAAAMSFAGNAAAGKADYNKACKSCHGADGKANPAIEKMMKVEMKDLKSPDVQKVSDADLKKIVEEGQGKMKPVKSLSGSAADDVVAYIKTLK